MVKVTNEYFVVLNARGRYRGNGGTISKIKINNIINIGINIEVDRW